MLELGVDAVLEHDTALARALIAHLDSLGAEVLSSRDAQHASGIVMARFPGRDGERIAGCLNNVGVVVSPRFNATRFALHHFNQLSDVETAADRLRSILSSPSED